MRQACKKQLALTKPWLDMERAKELEAISLLLDQHPRINDLVLQDLGGEAEEDGELGGGGSLSAEQVLRALIIKQMGGYSYRELAFHLADSSTYRTFCRIGIGEEPPSKSSLATHIKAVRAETLEALNRVIVAAAQRAGIENGRKVRVDCTVVESNIHEPTDSSLLWDGVRKLTELMEDARKVLGPEVVAFPRRIRRVKRRHREISTARTNEQRKKPYRDLIRVAEEVRATALRVLGTLRATGCAELAVLGIAMELEHYVALTQRVLDQTRRRILAGETVPAAEKIVSIFEEHTDILVKDRRQTLYGHKICLTAGASSMILD